MGFLDQLKNSFARLAEEMNLRMSEVGKLLRENQQYIDAMINLSTEQQEGIQAIKKYAEGESPAIATVFVTMGNALETIENNRTDMAKRLKIRYLQPIEGIVDNWKQLRVEIEEDEAAQKELAKTQKDFKKYKGASLKKRMTEEFQEAQDDLNEDFRKSEKEHDDVIEQTAYFRRVKIQNIKTALTVLVEEQKNFHHTALQLIQDAKDTVRGVNVRKDAEDFPFGKFQIGGFPAPDTK